jgi:hypothetical protein
LLGTPASLSLRMGRLEMPALQDGQDAFLPGE